MPPTKAASGRVNPQAGKGRIGDEAQAFPGAIVDDRKHPEPATIGELKRDWSTVVLHDITGWPDGVDGRPMLQLEDFIVAARDQGYEFVQEFSPDCHLIAKGKQLVDMAYLAH